MSATASNPFTVQMPADVADFLAGYLPTISQASADAFTQNRTDTEGVATVRMTTYGAMSLFCEASYAIEDLEGGKIEGSDELLGKMNAFLVELDRLTAV